jgi:hypothetical protein
MEILKVEDKKNWALIKRYNINAVPSIVIDWKIKVVGMPTFPWFCGDDFYKILQAKYPL